MRLGVCHKNTETLSSFLFVSESHIHCGKCFFFIIIPATEGRVTLIRTNKRLKHEMAVKNIILSSRKHQATAKKFIEKNSCCLLISSK